MAIRYSGDYDRNRIARILAECVDAVNGLLAGTTGLGGGGTGPAGPAGVTGTTSATGNTGPTGRTGPTGANGKTGATGPNPSNGFDPASNQNGTLSNSNFTWAADGTSGDGMVRTLTSHTIAGAGKYYAEFHYGTLGGSDSGVGACNGSAVKPSYANSGLHGSIVYNSGSAWTNGSGNGDVNDSKRAPLAGDYMAIQVDLSAMTAKYQNLTTGAALSAAKTLENAGTSYYLAVTGGNAGAGYTINTGNAAFQGTIPGGFSAWG